MTTAITFAAGSALSTVSCPRCAAVMSTHQRGGTVIDRCRACGGIYLDRDELDRIVDAEGRRAGEPLAVVDVAPAPMTDRDRSQHEVDGARSRYARPPGGQRGYRSDWADDRD